MSSPMVGRWRDDSPYSREGNRQRIAKQRRSPDLAVGAVAILCAASFTVCFGIGMLAALVVRWVF